MVLDAATAELKNKRKKDGNEEWEFIFYYVFFFFFFRFIFLHWRIKYDNGVPGGSIIISHMDAFFK